MAETETVPQTNGIDTIAEEDENCKTRPADIEADMREMERRKRVEGIMNSRLFREELERIVDSQMRDGGSSNILQQLSDIMGMPAARVGSVFKSSNCVVPINDIRGMEAMGYEKGEKILRCKLAAAFRLMDLYGWSQGITSLITARLNADQELFLVNPYGVLNHEITASSLNKVNMQGHIVEQGTTNFGVNTSQFTLHSVIHAARPDIRCAIYVGCNSVVSISALKQGLLPLTKDSALLGEISVHTYTGGLNEPEEKDKLLRSLGPVSKVLLLTNHGAICCGETVEEAFFAVTHIVAACEAQLKLLPVGLDNLIVIPEETRKAIYDVSRKPPEGVASQTVVVDNKERLQTPKWRVGGAEFEALMRMLDNAGFRTGYIYRNPLVKNDLPKPKNDVEVPPAVSSLGYLIEEEELFKQGIWKKGDFRKGGDRSKWLNSPNVYQKVEVLETGTPDPKKITKWVAEMSPTHSSTPVKIESAMQFVPANTNPKEFKRIQQQIKDYRRADKISAGPQSHILEGVSWDEANRLKDANVSATGDHVVLMGAASKGIIQRGYQHNATVYKAPYAKNPFDSVTDDELNEYKKTVEKKRQDTDTDFSESEALSSFQISDKNKAQPMSPVNQSESEDTATEHQVLRIETKQVPKPSQPEVVLSDELLNDATIDEHDVIGHFAKGFEKYQDSLVSSNWDLFNNVDVSSNKSLSLVTNTSGWSYNTKVKTGVPYSTQSFLRLRRKNAPFPYRTTTFFGFRSPNDVPMMTHFHIPIMPSSYLRRSPSTSLDNVFGTERYLYMTNDSLKQTIKRKLDFEHVHCPVRQRQYRDSETDSLYLMDIDSNNNKNLERISDVCEARLRDVHERKLREGSSFLEKLGSIRYSRPLTPESAIISTVDFPEVCNESSFLDHTRKLFSTEDASSVLDSTDIEILQKIENHSRSYGTVPVLYHKIEKQILNRKDYENIDIDSLKVTRSTQTEDANKTYSLTSIETQTCPMTMQPKNLRSERMPCSSLQKTVKNCRNRNFVLENIQNVKHKCNKFSSNRNATKKSETPSTVKAGKSMRKHRKNLKRRSLQFSTDEEYDEYSTGSATNFQIIDHAASLKRTCDDQLECIIKMGDTLDQMRSDVDEIVQLQGEIDSARQTHSEMAALRTVEDYRRMNGNVSSSVTNEDD